MRNYKVKLPENDKYAIVLVPDKKEDDYIYLMENLYNSEDEAKEASKLISKEGYSTMVTDVMV